MKTLYEHECFAFVCPDGSFSICSDEKTEDDVWLAAFPAPDSRLLALEQGYCVGKVRVLFEVEK